MVYTLEEKKGEDIILLDLTGQDAFTDYFVICSGPSTRTLKALSDEIQRGMKTKFHLSAQSVEGEPDGGWILLDYSSVVVHIFSPPVRAYYQLEDLWHEANILLRIQ